MKKLLFISSTVLSLCTFSGITADDALGAQSAPTAKTTKANLAAHGLHYGTLNHIHSLAAFYEALKSDKVIVKFSAPWCHWCTKLTPIVQKLTSTYQSILFIEVNVDSFPTLKNKYGAHSLPTMIFFKNGSLAHRTVGFKNSGFWKNKIKAVFGL